MVEDFVKKSIDDFLEVLFYPLPRFGCSSLGGFNLGNAADPAGGRRRSGCERSGELFGFLLE